MASNKDITNAQLQGLTNSELLMLKAAGISADAAVEAAGISASAYQEGLELQKEMWDEAKELNMPWVEHGEWALGELKDKMTAFDGSPEGYVKSPYFDWLQGQGIEALDRSAAARGKLNSGAQQEAIVQYGQNVASTDFDNYLRRYYDSLKPFQQMASEGGASARSLGGLSAQYANSMSNITGAIGDAQASGVLGEADAWSNYYSQLGQNAIEAGDIRASGYANDINQSNTTKNALWNLAGQATPYLLENAGSIWDGAKDVGGSVANWFVKKPNQPSQVAAKNPAFDDYWG